jgi:SAM-dependent methyltransferase
MQIQVSRFYDQLRRMFDRAPAPNSLMRRIHLIELSDQPWFPDVWRTAMTGYLNFVARVGGHGRPIAALLRVAIERSGATRIVDIGSGGGGPVIDAFRELARERSDLGLTLTDLRPNVAALEAAAATLPGRVEVVRDGVDATRVPRSIEGVRTLFNAFHHLKPAQARGVLQDAIDARQPVVIAEMLVRHPVIVAINLGSWTGAMLALPFQRPFRWSWLLWGWLLPVIPIAITWDATVSALRIYTERELREMIASIEGSDDYDWEFGRAWFAPAPMRGMTLIGTPRRHHDDFGA